VPKAGTINLHCLCSIKVDADASSGKVRWSRPRDVVGAKRKEAETLQRGYQGFDLFLRETRGPHDGIEPRRKRGGFAGEDDKSISIETK
jgi:hypothetical protein